MDGPPHLPPFFSSVAIGSETFSGEAGNSKKAAEMNASKVAYTALKLPPSGSPETEANLTEPVQSPEASRLVEKAVATGNQTVPEDSSLHTCQKKRKFNTV